MVKQMNVAAFLKALGGDQVVRSVLRVTAPAVCNWRARNTLPANTYVVLKTMAADAGVEAPDRLWSMRGFARKAKR